MRCPAGFLHLHLSHHFDLIWLWICVLTVQNPVRKRQIFNCWLWILPKISFSSNHTYKLSCEQVPKLHCWSRSRKLGYSQSRHRRRALASADIDLTFRFGWEDSLDSVWPICIYLRLLCSTYNASCAWCSSSSQQHDAVLLMAVFLLMYGERMQMCKFWPIWLGEIPDADSSVDVNCQTRITETTKEDLAD